jgi:mRNA interferase HigB
VQIIARRTLRVFWDTNPEAERPLKAWYATVTKAEWAGPADVKAEFGSVDLVADNRAIFNIGGNKYRLVVHIAYRHQKILIKFVGTHADYDRINAATVDQH